MTKQEFDDFKRGLAKSIVKFKRGKINADELYEDMFVTLGEDTFEETERLMEKANKK